MQTHAPDRLEGAQTLDNVGPGLLNNGNIADYNNKDNDEKH